MSASEAVEAARPCSTRPVSQAELSALLCDAIKLYCSLSSEPYGDEALAGLAVTPTEACTVASALLHAARFDTEFFTSDMRSVVGEGGGISHAIVGTILVTLVAAIMSVPLGVFTAVYLVEYGGKSRLAKAITAMVDVMAGSPRSLPVCSPTPSSCCLVPAPARGSPVPWPSPSS